MAQLHKDGHCTNMNKNDLQALYEKEGIVLRKPGSNDFHCGLGPGGEHVVLGGKSLIPPEPGTVYFERVVLAPARQGASQADNNEK
jgi:hypothetical protein